MSGVLWRLMETAKTIQEYRLAQAGMLRIVMDGSDQARAFSMGMGMDEYQSLADECIWKFSPSMREIAGESFPMTFEDPDDRRNYSRACLACATVSTKTNRPQPIVDANTNIMNRYRIYANMIRLEFVQLEFDEALEWLGGKVSGLPPRITGIMNAIDTMEKDWVKYMSLGLWRWTGIELEFTKQFKDVLDHPLFKDKESYSPVPIISC